MQFYIFWNIVQIGNPTRCDSLSQFFFFIYMKLNMYHHTPTVKPEAATAVIELLMMGVRTPETH
jgi:hypothetical protein